MVMSGNWTVIGYVLIRDRDKSLNTYLQVNTQRTDRSLYGTELEDKKGMELKRERHLRQMTLPDKEVWLISLPI